MAGKKKTVTAAGKTSVPVARNDAPKFTVERLRDNCMKLFGVGICTYAGATHGLSGGYTVDEMRNIINKWKAQEVN